MKDTCKMSYMLNHSQIGKEIPMEEFVEEIRSNKHKEKIEEIRRLHAAGETGEANRLKSTLQGVVTAGLFHGRRIADCIREYTFQCVLDFDGIPVEQRGELRQTVENCPYTRLRYTSPRQGEKIVVCGEPVEIPAEWTQEQRVSFFRKYHKCMFGQLVILYEKLTGCKIDVSGSDLSRISYVSHDGQAYYDPGSVLFPVDLNGSQGKRPRISRSAVPVYQDNRLIPESDHSLNAELHRMQARTRQAMAEQGIMPLGEEGNQTKQQEKIKKSEVMLFRICEMLVKRDKNYEEGNRNNFLFVLACKCNEYGVEKELTFSLMADRYPDMEEADGINAVESAYKNTDKHGIYTFSRQQIRVLFAQNYLSMKYEFRYNEIKSTVEYCEKEGDPEFIHVDDRVRNSLWVELSEHGAECSTEQLHSILNSDFSTTYNPLKEYFENLPSWDGKDHIGIFADRVQTTRQSYWKVCFEKWLCAMVATVIFPDVHNHTVVTMAGNQSIGKTTFSRSILPPELKEYYCEDKINPDNKDDMIKVYQSLIINTEEVDGMTGKELNQYKALITRSNMLIRLPYDRSTKVRKRLASFMSTTNNRDILNDYTGTRRFLCFEALSFDNESPINYEQLYSQVMHKLIVEKFKYWFDKEEAKKINKNNESFVQLTTEEELVATNFRIPGTADKISYLTASDIADLLHKRNGILITHAGKITIGRALRKLGYSHITCCGGTSKYVVHVIHFEEVTLNKHINDEVEKEPEATQQKLDI